MKCPECHHDDSKVLESRASADGKSIRRRRECRNCGRRTTTYEKEEEVLLQVKKRDGSLQPFCHRKVLRSLQIACQKRPVQLEQIESAISRLEQVIQRDSKKVIPSSDLGELLMAELYDLDKVAYLRFASVYKDFQNLNEFRDIINAIETRPRLREL